MTILLAMAHGFSVGFANRFARNHDSLTGSVSVFRVRLPNNVCFMTILPGYCTWLQRGICEAKLFLMTILLAMAHGFSVGCANRFAKIHDSLTGSVSVSALGFRMI